MELSGRFKVIKVLTKTKANGWSILKEGDIIVMTLTIAYNGRLGSSGYTVHQVFPTIKIENSDIEWKDSFNRISERITKTFELIQL